MNISQIEAIRKYDRERKRTSRLGSKKQQTDPTANEEIENAKILRLVKSGEHVNRTMKFSKKEGTDRSPVTEVTEKIVKRLQHIKPVLSDKYRLASRYLRKMMELKKRKKMVEFEKVGQEVLGIFLTKRDFAHFAYETERVIYRLFDIKHKEIDDSKYTKKLKSGLKEEIRQHSISKHNANVFPTARFGRYYYLRCPISQLHADWLNSHRQISRSSVYRNMDKNVKPMRKTPHLQCYCKECGNLEFMGKELFKANVTGACGNARHAVEMTWCQFTSNQYGYKKRDIYDKTCRQFPKIDCVQRKCKKCGSDMLHERIKLANKGKVKWSKAVEWEKWDYVNKKLDSVTKRGTLEVLLSNYILHLDMMSGHRFFDMWMGHQFNLLLDNIVLGLVVFVNDFAQNILLRYQSEPSSIHWIHKQVTLHPSIAYFMCPGCKKVVIKEEIFHLTSSLDHTWKTVDHFMKFNLAHLRSKGVAIERIHDVTDNAASQYKSRFVWNHLSTSDVPWCRHHFAANHGKGPSDRASGFFKNFIRDHVLSQNVVLKNVDLLAKFAAKEMDEQPDSTECLHLTHRKVVLSKEIVWPTCTYEDSCRPHIMTENGKKKKPIHGIRSTGIPGIVQIRSIDCCCSGCIRMTGKCQAKQSDPWSVRSVQKGLQPRESMKTHWKKFQGVLKGKEATAKYPIMENKELSKSKRRRKLKSNGGDGNDTLPKTTDETEDEDDMSLAKLRKMVCETENGTENFKPDQLRKKVGESYVNHAPVHQGKEDDDHMESEEEDDMPLSKLRKLYSESRRRMENVTNQEKHSQQCKPSNQREDYLSLKAITESETLSEIQSAFPFDYLLESDVVDDTALSFRPEDAPVGFVPVTVGSDGNCFPRCISRLIYGHENQHMEIRKRIVAEAVSNKHLYMDNDHLNLGQSIERDRTYMYYMYSQCYDAKKSLEDVYEAEVLTIKEKDAYMGLWQIHQVANVLKRPVGIVYPSQVRRDLREDCNRIFYPRGPTEREAIYILWHPMDMAAPEHRVCHFSPLIKW